MTVLESIQAEATAAEKASFTTGKYVRPEDAKRILSRERLEALLKGRSFDDELIHGIVNRVIEKDLQPSVLALVASFGFPGVEEKRDHINFASSLEDMKLPIKADQLEKLSPKNFKSLGNVQHKFCPFKFPRNMHDILEVLPGDFVIPFTDEERRENVEGSFGEIWESKIDPSLQEFFPCPPGNVVVIRKVVRQFKHLETKEKYQERIRRERKCLVMLRRLEHENIIPLLGCYIFKDEASFLFPLLNKDLDQLLAGEKPAQFLSDFTLYAALRGLASALSSMHKMVIDKDVFKAYHHDLRPANILIGPVKGTAAAARESDTPKDAPWTFHLADFGLSNLKREREPSVTFWKGNNGHYQGPEARAEALVGRALDVWAFGCMMIEVATYIRDGPGGVTNFRKEKVIEPKGHLEPDKRFYHGQRVKPEVEGWLAQMESNSQSGRYSLLADIARLARKCLLMAPDMRLKMPDVLNELSKISLKAHFAHLLDALPTGNQYEDYNRRIKDWGSNWGMAPGSTVESGIRLEDDTYRTLVNNITGLIYRLQATGAKNDDSSKLEAIRSFVDEIGRGSGHIRKGSAVPEASLKGGTDPDRLPQASIYVVGSLNVDTILCVETLPTAGCHDRESTLKKLEKLGGHGFNQAIACARLSNSSPDPDIGHSVESDVPMELHPYRLKLHISMVGLVGEDEYGARLKTSLKFHGINTEYLLSHEEGTGRAAIDLDPKGASMVRNTHEGANTELTKDFLPPGFPRDTDMVLVQVETPIDTALETVKRANRASVSVVLNLAPKPAKGQEIPEGLFNVDHLIMNAATAYGIKMDRESNNGRGPAGSAGVGQQEPSQRCWTEFMDDCQSFADKGARVVVITLGHRGAVALKMKERGGKAMPNNFVVERVHLAAKCRKGLECQDTTGASDAFIGAYVVELLRQQKSGEEENVNAAIDAGVKSGGLSIYRVGSADSMPWGDQLENYDDFEWMSNT
ncbi:hypothetical protein PspLS_11278 [Pyricularia sp. CBS 133598]|nr:hypothetical protein PspLS_11278 [Pyricularia sp. CBS 133598]